MPETLRYLAAQLQEHLTRLRQRPATSGSRRTGAPAALARAVIAGRLLLHAGDQANLPVLSTWLEALQSLLEWHHAHPTACPVSMDQAVQRLAAVQQKALERLDAGEDLASILTGEDLASIQSELIESTAAPLRPRRGVRERKPRPAADPEVSGRQRVLLITGGHFRTGCLCRILADAGLTVVACPHPVEAWTHLRSGERFNAVVCDNVEPSAHLRTLRGLMRGRDRRLRVPVVLVSAAGGQDMAPLARRLGAIGVWQPPYPVEDLLELLSNAPPPGN